MRLEGGFWISFLRDEDGQATAEYLLILAVVISVFMLTLKTVLGPSIDKLKGRLTEAIGSALFSPNGMYRFRVGR